MKLVVVAALLLTDLATSEVKFRHVGCTCLMNKVNYKRIDVDCDFNSTNLEAVSGMRDKACSKETAGYVPDGYEFLPGMGFYKLYKMRALYEKALAWCEEDGASLAVPQSQQEAQAIGNIVKKTPSVEAAFIGINDITNTGTYHSIQGVPMSSLAYNQWAPGQPDNDGPYGESCVTIFPDGTYNDFSCYMLFHFMCHRPMTPLPPSGYKYLPQMGFHKHYLEPETYEGAKKRCLADGGHLAVLDSQEEAEEVLKFYDINTSVKESYIGLNDIAQEGVFISETGKPITSLGFNNWYSGEPNNANNEDCVTFFHFGTMNDVVCSLKYPFFCEIPLPSK